jgi:hypothetical protein
MPVIVFILKEAPYSPDFGCPLVAAVESFSQSKKLWQLLHRIVGQIPDG